MSKSVERLMAFDLEDQSAFAYKLSSQINLDPWSKTNVP